MLLLTKCLYINLTMNNPFLCRFHTNKSMPSFKLTCTSFETGLLCHSVNFFLTRALLKETLSGFVRSTSSTVACFFLTMLNKFWFWNFRAWVPNHLSTQNLNRLPLFSLNFPRFRN